MKSLLIEVMPGEIRAAAVRDERVVELFIERRGRESLVGNVYLGRVERILDGMDAAFVDIGIGKSGFLGLGRRRALAIPALATRRNGSAITSSRARPFGCRSSRTRSTARGRSSPGGSPLPGVISSTRRPSNRIAVSRQIADPDERCPSGGAGGERGPNPAKVLSSVPRRRAPTAPELADDAAYLRRLWSETDAKAKAASPPSCVHEEPPASAPAVSRSGWARRRRRSSSIRQAGSPRRATIADASCRS